jgi:hypothetical protein
MACAPSPYFYQERKENRNRNRQILGECPESPNIWIFRRPCKKTTQRRHDSLFDASPSLLPFQKRASHKLHQRLLKIKVYIFLNLNKKII